MIRKQKTATINGQTPPIASDPAKPAIEHEHNPDVPQHPLDGPIPTD